MKIRVNRALIMIVGFVVVLLILFFILGRISRSSNFSDELLSDLIKVQTFSSDTEEECKQDYVNKCFMARQVYQYQWYRSTPTKVGNLNLTKQYGMSLKEFNEVVELSWQLNQYLAIPWRSPINFYMLSKWILESAIYNKIEHKTGEIIKMAGYTEEGFRDALYHYKYDMGITRGHPCYIRELFRSYLTVEEIQRIFEDPLNVVKFDYVYIAYLGRVYDWEWDWILTSFHFGDGKTLFWKGAGLKMIPNYRLNGTWKGYYLREYYQTVVEIAQGIANGTMSRPSRYTRTVGVLRKANEARSKYIQTLRIKLRADEESRKMELQIITLVSNSESYRKKMEDMVVSMAALSDLTLEVRRDKNNPVLKEKLRSFKRKAQARWKELTAKKPAGRTNS